MKDKRRVAMVGCEWADGLKIHPESETCLVCAPSSPSEKPTREDDGRFFREALWLGHGHDGLYGDDGEMQCGRAGQHGDIPGPIDFKRDSAARIWDAAMGAIRKPTREEPAEGKGEEPRRKEGTWPQVCVQRAFVEGGEWWQYHSNGATAFPSERDEMAVEAVKRYGEPDPLHDDDCPLYGRSCSCPPSLPGPDALLEPSEGSVPLGRPAGKP